MLRPRASEELSILAGLSLRRPSSSSDRWPPGHGAGQRYRAVRPAIRNFMRHCRGAAVGCASWVPLPLERADRRLPGFLRDWVVPGRVE